MKRTAWILAVVLLGLLAAQASWAADAPTGGGLSGGGLIKGVVETVLYGFLGILLAIVGYRAFDLITPFDLAKELAEDQNVAVAIVVGAIVLGVSLIISLTILSP